jgi:hypothetical protein
LVRKQQLPDKSWGLNIESQWRVPSPLEQTKRIDETLISQYATSLKGGDPDQSKTEEQASILMFDAEATLMSKGGNFLSQQLASQFCSSQF